LKLITEKFTDSNDPIQDMGIGVLSQLKPGNVLQCTLGIKPRVNNRDPGYISKFWIMPGWYSVIKKIEIIKSPIKKSKIELELSTYDKFPTNMKMVDLKYSGGEYLTIFPEEFFDHFDVLPTKVDEKFEAESDPIRDLGIGDLDKVIKHRIQELSHTDAEDKALFSYWYVTHGVLDNRGGQFCITLIGSIGFEQREWILKYCEKRIKEAELKEFLDTDVKTNGDKQVLWNIKPQYVKHFLEAEKDRYAKKRQSAIDEKFKEDSDPIHDMGIGLFIPRDFTSKKEMHDFLAKNMEGIFKVKELPKAFMALAKNGGGVTIKSANLDHIERFVKKYITINGWKDSPRNMVSSFELADRLAALNKGVIYLSKEDWESKKIHLDPPLVKLRKTSKRRIHETFSDESDPIHDMGIGAIKWKDIKSGDILRVKKHINLSHPLNSYVYLTDVMRNGHGVITQIYYWNYENKDELLTRIKTGFPRGIGSEWAVEPEFLEKHLEIVQRWEFKNEVNEKFIEDSDALKDMGVGQQYFKNKLIELIPEQIPLRKSYNVRDYLLYVINDDATTVEINDNVITVTCTEYSKQQFFAILSEVLRFYSTKGIAKIKTRNYIMNIFLDKPVNEKFSDTSDPIQDMGIGNIHETIPIYAIITESPPLIIDTIEQKPAKEFLKKNGIDYKIMQVYKSGIGCVIYWGPKSSLNKMFKTYFQMKPETYDQYMKKMK